MTAVTSARPVIRLASQPSPSRARVPTRTLQWPSWKYVVTRPTQSRLSHGPDEAAAASSTRPAARPAACRPASGRAATAWNASSVPRRRRRRSCRSPASGASRPVSAPATSASSIACAEPDCWSMTPVRSAGRVAPARSWSQSTSIRSRSARLRCSAPTIATTAAVLDSLPGQDPVDRAAAAADPALGPLVADRRQRPAYRLDDLLVLGHPGLGEVPVQPVVDEQAPVVGGRRGAVLLAHPGAAAAAGACRRGAGGARRGRPRAAP